MKQFIIIIPILIFCVLLTGCEKFLEEKTDKKLVIPSTLKDYQALLDDNLNLRSDPSEGEVAADDYYLNDADWQGLNDVDRSAYIWEKDNSTARSNWLYSYRQVNAANIVLDEIKNIEKDDRNEGDWNNVKGQALFLRARGHLSVIVNWANSYDDATADDDMGIPLRLSSDFNVVSVRSSLRESYQQIINDLKEAIKLLPIKPVHVVRASKPAAQGLLARTYLFMRDYKNCYTYANDCLGLKNELMDFNNLNKSNTYPIAQFNKEVIYESQISAQPIRSVYAKIDSTLISTYEPFDIRRYVFFNTDNNSKFSFRGSYIGGVTLFSGIAADEVYLMRAECHARLGRLTEAQEDLNHLLIHRWEKGKYVPYEFNSEKDALEQILLERRKELIMRGLRWPDIKRLNKEGANISLKRNINGKDYILPANDLRFALSIPEDVIERAPTIIQNPR